TFASRALTEMSEADRPAVQIGDPFTKKLIIEATLEAIKTGYVRGLKDLGGGGLSCALSELTGDGGTGASVDMGKIFMREPGMNSFEVMLSESQERMAFIVQPEGLEEVLNVFRKFEMAHAVIGRTDDTQVLKVYDGDNLVVNLPATALSDAPTIPRKEKRPDYLDDLLAQKTPEPSKKLDDIILELIASENICSKEWIYRQYDHEVGVRSVLKCGEGDSGVLRIIGTNKFISSSVGTNSKHCFLDPYNGSKGGMIEICGNVIANGARPKAMVNCCNFGNPEIPESFWYFAESVKGMADFCREMKIPIVGGNVSFYNEDEATKTAIKPAPVIMIVGIIEGEENIITLPFKDVGSDVLLIGKTKAELGGSEYHSVIYEMEGGTPPLANEKEIKLIWDFIFELYKGNLVKSNHDVNKGGFIIAVAEMCFKNNIGVNLDLNTFQKGNLKDDELLFSESVGRFIVETSKSDYDKIIDLGRKYKISVKRIGTTIMEPEIRVEGLKTSNFTLNLKKMKHLYDSTIPNLMDK
ncbi:MAG: AIR synthase-related protein, partial [Candidatus Lokiarchaeota archaeon]|nr:AIR synthase-related protein [Candidatus Lokiarchaeota archaeon]